MGNGESSRADSTTTAVATGGKAGGKRYDAFISYSHAADGAMAPALQKAMQAFARPWRKRRALEVFRDETGLAVNPDLWASICQAMDGSEWFVLLCSPAAAQSEWVGKEIERWVATKPLDRLLLVITEGTFHWDDAANDIDRAGSTAAHPALYGLLSAEPRHIDMGWARGETDLNLRHSRFRDQVAEIAAPMHGVTKDELEGEDVRQHRRLQRVTRAGVSALAILLVLAMGSAAVAVSNGREASKQRDQAELQRSAAEAAEVRAVDQARTATSQRLAGLSRTAEGSLRALLAVQGHRMAETPEATGAMVEALSGDAEVEARLVGHDGVITRISYSPDGTHVATVDTSAAVRVFTAAGLPVTAAEDAGARDAAFVTDDVIAIARGSALTFMDLEGNELGEHTGLAPSTVGPSGTGDVLVGTTSGEVLRMDLDGEVLASSDEPTDTVYFVGASADGSKVVSVSQSPTTSKVTLHDGEDLSVESSWETDGQVLALDASGERVAVAPKGGGDPLDCADCRGTVAVEVRAADDGSEVGVATNFELYLAKAAAFTPDGGSLVFATTGGVDGAPGQAFIGAIGEQPQAATSFPTALMDRASSVGISPDGTSAVIGGSDPDAIVVPLGGGEFGGVIEFDGAQPTAPLTVSAPANLATVTDGSEVGVGDLTTGDVRMLGTSEGGNAALSPDGTRLLTSRGLLDVETGEPVGDVPTPQLGIRPAFTADSSLVVYVTDEGGDGKSVAVVEIADGALRGSGYAPSTMCPSYCDPSVAFVAISPDGDRLVVRTPPQGVDAYKARVAVVDISDGWEPLATIDTEEGGGPVRFSEEGDQVTIQSDLTVRTYEVDTLEVAIGERSAQLSGRWDEDGGQLAVASRCGATLIDPTTLRSVAEIPITTYEVEGGDCNVDFDATWLPGTSTLLTVGEDCGQTCGTVLNRWGLDPDSLAEALCAQAGRNLSEAEWSQFLPDWDYERTCEQWPAGATPADEAPTDEVPTDEEPPANDDPTDEGPDDEGVTTTEPAPEEEEPAITTTTTNSVGPTECGPLGNGAVAFVEIGDVSCEEAETTLKEFLDMGSETAVVGDWSCMRPPTVEFSVAACEHVVDGSSIYGAFLD